MWQSSPWQQFSKKDWCRKKFCLSSCPVCCPNESEMQIKICFYFNCNKICCWLPKWINYSSSREGGGQRLKSKHTNSAHFLLNAQNLFLRNIKTEHFLLVQLQEITNLSKLFCHSNGLFFLSWEAADQHFSRLRHIFLFNFKARHITPQKD